MQIKKRDLAVTIILSIVTCGIYGIVWIIGLGDDIKTLSGDPSAPSGGTLFLLSLVTCNIYYMIWAYKAGERLNAVKAANGMPTDSNSGLVYLLLCVFGLGIVANALIQNELNKFATV